MAIVKIIRDLYPGWRIGDHVAVFGDQLEKMKAEMGCEVTEEDNAFGVKPEYFPPEEPVLGPEPHIVEEPVKKKKGKK
jgi:hypothetical protein